MGLTQSGLLTLSEDPRGSWVFCTLCVFSAQCLVHCYCMHAHPLCFTSPCTTTPSHAPFSFSIFLLHPVHLSTSLPVTLTSLPGVRCFHCVIAFNILCHSHNWSGRVWLGFKVHASIPIFRQFCIKCSSILCIIIVAQYCECDRG